jgi:hypothetical protein
MYTTFRREALKEISPYQQGLIGQVTCRDLVTYHFLEKLNANFLPAMISIAALDVQGLTCAGAQVAEVMIFT